MTFHQWFYKKLQENDYKSLCEFCELNGVPKSVTSRYIREQRTVPVGFIVTLADAFDIPVQEVIDAMDRNHVYRIYTKRKVVIND